MNFNSILIGSENPAQLVAYYAKLFGQPQFSDGGYSTFLLGSGGVTIGPHTQVAEMRMRASVGSTIVGSGRSSNRTSRGP